MVVTSKCNSTPPICRVLIARILHSLTWAVRSQLVLRAHSSHFIKRLHLTDSLLRNKAEVTAAQLYAIDPYLNVYTYSEGLHQKNIDSFLGGSKKEPPADFVIEEVDDPHIKIFIREQARKRKIPVIMASDLGSCVNLISHGMIKMTHYRLRMDVMMHNYANQLKQYMIIREIENFFFNLLMILSELIIVKMNLRKL